MNQHPWLNGYDRHGFATMEQLVNSVTWAWEQKRFLKNDEQLAMITNPGPFLWQGEAIDDRLMLRDSYFLLAMPDDLNNMRIVSQALNGAWYDYKILGERSKEKRCGILKNRQNNRQVDEELEVCLERWEVKGNLRVRRLCCLPPDFEARAHYPPPDPAPVCIQWQRLLRHVPARQRAAQALTLGEPNQPGPVRPRGTLDHMQPV
ncbi:unnamed protein product [Urochloa humidicola]